MDMGLVSGIGHLVIAQLKTGVPNGSGTGRIHNLFHLFEPFPDKQVRRGFIDNYRFSAVHAGKVLDES
jgi:hypothetical protein